MILDTAVEMNNRQAYIAHDADHYYVCLDFLCMLVTESPEQAVSAFENAVKILELELSAQVTGAFSAWSHARNEVVKAARASLKSGSWQELIAVLRAEECARAAYEQSITAFSRAREIEESAPVSSADRCEIYTRAAQEFQRERETKNA